MSNPIIAVIGATGAQGGSVVRYLKRQGGFRVRALTRHPESYRGPAEEVARADLDDDGSLVDALRGAHGVFLVTNFWQSGTDERKQAAVALHAGREAGVHHMVWSTLPDVAAISGGKWDVPHFTGKAQIDELVREAGFPQHSFVQPAFYFENLLRDFAPQPLPGGQRGWTLPIDPEARVIHMASVTEFGALVAGVFAKREMCAGRTLSMAAGLYSFTDVIEAAQTTLGETFGFQRVPLDVFSGFFPRAREVGNMLGYFEDYTYMGPDAETRLDRARSVSSAPFTPLTRWLADAASKFLQPAATATS